MKGAERLAILYGSNENQRRREAYVCKQLGGGRKAWRPNALPAPSCKNMARKALPARKALLLIGYAPHPRWPADEGGTFS